MSRSSDAEFVKSQSARAERRAASSQIGWPEGASAVCGSARPSASPTTCAVAAVPEKLASPAGRRAGPASHFGGIFERDLLLRKARAERLDLARIFARFRQQRDPAGHEHRRAIFRIAASAIIMAGRPLSQVAIPRTPLPVGSERIRRRRTIARIVAKGQRIQHARACPACGRRRDRCTRRRRESRATISILAPPRRRAVPLPSGRCGIRARSPRRFPRADRRGC